MFLTTLILLSAERQTLPAVAGITGSRVAHHRDDFDQVKAAPKVGDEVAVIKTSLGNIVVMFFPSKAPKHVENFISLAKESFYDHTRFHRCIPGFMIQGGDPLTADIDNASRWGTGGKMIGSAERTVRAEFNDVKHLRGVLSMARSMSPDSASSQFFIMHKDAPSLDGKYSAFGKVVSGLETIDKIVLTGNETDNGSVEPTKAIVISSMTIEKWPLPDKGEQSK